jgi:hypothetical protein
MSDAAFLGWMTAIQQEMETTLDALLPSADHDWFVLLGLAIS